MFKLATHITKRYFNETKIHLIIWHSTLTPFYYYVRYLTMWVQHEMGARNDCFGMHFTNWFDDWQRLQWWFGKHNDSTTVSFDFSAIYLCSFWFILFCGLINLIYFNFIVVQIHAIVLGVVLLNFSTCRMAKTFLARKKMFSLS